MAGSKELTALAPADRNVAMVFQSYALYPHLTAAQNIAVPLAMRQLTRAHRLPLIGNFIPGQKQIRTDIQKQVAEMARSLKIEHLLDRKPGQMSGGQRQRVALARAMVRRPSLFLMDEPLSNLDANLRVHARGEIVELHRKAGVPTLYVTHDQAEALSMADRVAVMIGGNLLQLAAPRTIYDDPAHVEVARFLGQPRINTLDVEVSTGRSVALGSARLLIGAAVRVKDDVTIAVRPEHLRVYARNAAGLPAHVERLEFLGSVVVPGTGYVPNNELAAKSPQYLGDFYKKNPLFLAGLSQMPRMIPWYAFPGSNGVRVTQAIVDNLWRVVDQSAKPDQALEDAAREVKRLLPRTN